MLKPLSKKESEVFNFVVEGLTNDEIARQMSISSKTVKFHTTKIFKKVEVKSRAKLIVNYYKNLNKGAI